MDELTRAKLYVRDTLDSINILEQEITEKRAILSRMKESLKDRQNTVKALEYARDHLINFGWDSNAT